MNVTHDIAGVQQAALDLMVESLREEDLQRQIENVLMDETDFLALAKLFPVRHLPQAHYEFASYVMWMRGMIDSGVAISIAADEAEGLRAIEAARQEFERDHPGCPRCGVRQYSRTAMSCRKCMMKFERHR